MKVTKIEVQKNNKNKVNIYCDNEYLFSLHTETLLKNGISVGAMLTESAVENLKNADDEFKALQIASTYVSKGVKSRKQVRDFLKKKEYSAFIVNNVISKLEEYKLIDDNSYIQAFIHDHTQYGELKLKQLLLNKGISKQKIDEFFLDYNFDIEILQDLANKYLKNKENNYENVLKCKKYLLSHGFSYDQINQLNWGENEDWN